MNRSTISLAGAVAVLVVLTGMASLTGGSDHKAASAAAPRRMPVQRTTLLCPAPSSSEFADTTYTSYTPQGAAGSAGAGGSSAAGSAQLVPAATKGKPLASLGQPGKPATYATDKSDAPALIGTADGTMAPGWTAEQTTVISSGTERGLLGISCVTPDTEFWFPGASTDTGRQDYLHLVNPDDTPAVVDVELYGKDGQLKASTGDGLTVPGRSSKPVLLSTLVADKATDLTVHVVARTGRVGAAVQATDAKLGVDWLPPAAEPATALVLPGIPGDATDVRLIAYATGTDDADLTLKLATPTGAITPAGHETLHVKAGMTTAVDLGDVTKGDPGSLLIGAATSHSPVPVVAALRVTRGKGSKQEMAFLPATEQIETRATVADNRARGSLLSLIATAKDASVRITSSAGSTGGTAASKTVTVKAGTTLVVPPPQPAGLRGTYAVTVEPVSGGPVYASRTLALTQNGVPMFTIQPMPDDHGLVDVPQAAPDLRILNR
ncbi:DUF5719 family protein [Streptomyces sp. HPF1205]|uniref:DUF5719 family protein n=1 Tax=Streptomyces sp. HPF1205 TaxID=2873262 RepID=UPI001CED901E|nr:DUF5719 family protein [Streptomyces sp. HPF1205]